MSHTTKPLCFKQAQNLAEKITAEIQAYCQRFLIVGSVRRQKPINIHDIEAICIPTPAPNLLDWQLPGTDMLYIQLQNLVNDGRLIRANKGSGTNPTFFIPALYDKASKTGFKFELIISTTNRWPVEVAIKTGCAEFSHKLVMKRQHGGFLPSDCLVTGGWEVWRGDERLAFAEERDFIEFACGKWIEPPQRS